MAIHLPSHGEIECDHCNETVDVDLSEFAGDPVCVGLDEVPDGWVTIDGEHYCPRCKLTYDEGNV